MSTFVIMGNGLATIGMRLSENDLAAARIEGRSRVQRSRAVPPVRFVHPRAGDDAALVFSSALGGGMLEGDDYRFSIDCGPGATMMFAPQANTRIFPCPGGETTRQSIRGTVYADGLVVSGGDPVVPYAASRFSQSQTWVVHPGARLVLVDWMIAGRLERGERFAFADYESVTRVETPEGRPLLTDSLRLRPDEDGMENVAAGFGGHAALLVVHVVGPGWETLHGPLDAWLRQPGTESRPRWMAEARLAGLGIREGRGFSLRALGADRTALEPLAGLIFGCLADKDWLGFDFWARKY